MSVRVRFAPSPTGYLHVGGARTALFNWLFARRHRGHFILRIEDTDTKRSDEDMVRGILEGLTWLGLTWDEGPYFQSERVALYAQAAQRLVKSGRAYRDFSPVGSPEGSHLESRELTYSESQRRAVEGAPYAIRFRVPRGRSVAFSDLVFGDVSVETDTLEDFVILRSDGSPTYHLSVVTDDSEMNITHVIRGADHLPNTCKHVLLFQALETPPPTFAHLPLILGSDKKRLSKRHGATSVSEYSRLGFLPSAVRNYLALLGWSPGDDAELLSGQELVERFSLDKVNKANAVFDLAKLEWMNKRHISSTSAGTLLPYVKNELIGSGLWLEAWEEEEREWLLDLIDLLKPRVQSLQDFVDSGYAFFSDTFEYESKAVKRYLEPSEVGRSPLLRALRQLRQEFAALEPFDVESTEICLRSVCAEFNLKPGQFIGAVRLAATGRGQAPGIFDVLIFLGRNRTLERLERVINFLTNE